MADPVFGNSQTEDVAINILLRSVLKRFERTAKYREKSNLSYSDKIFIMKEFLILKIAIGRLLAVFRFARKNTCPSSFAQYKNKYFAELENKIDQKFGFLKIGYSDTTQDNKKAHASNISDRSSIENLRQFYEYFSQKPPNQRLAKANSYNKKLFTIYNKEYFLVYRLNKHFECTLDKCYVDWPKNCVQLKPSIIKKILAPYIMIEPDNMDKIRELDLQLHQLFLTGQFVYIVGELIKLTDVFNFTIIKKKDVIKIKFLDQYRPYDTFRLFISNGIIQFASKTPLFNPHNIKESYYFNMNDADAKLFDEYDNSLINLVYVPFETNITELVSFMHDCVIATRVSKVWNMICLAVFVNPLPAFEITVEFKNKQICFPCIEIHALEKIILRTTFCPYSGKAIAYNTVGKVNLNDALDAGLYQLRELFAGLMSQALSYVVLREDTNTMAYDSKMPDEFKQASNEITIAFSFAKDFRFRKVAHMQRVSVYPVTVGPREEVVPSIAMIHNNHCTLKTHFERFAEMNRIIKTEIMLLQLEKNLRDLGCRTRRVHNIVNAELPSSLRIEMKISTTGFWWMAFDESSSPFHGTDLSIITGNKFSARFPDKIVNTIMLIETLWQLFNRANGSTLVQFQPSSLFRENNLMFSIKDEMYKMFVYIDNLGFLGTIWKYAQIFDTVGSSVPTLKIKICPSIPLSICFNTENELSKDFVEGFGSFLSGSLSSLVKFVSIFNKQPGWTITSITPSMAFFLIYRGIMTLNVQLKPVRDFAVVIPKMGRSTSLHTPMAIYPPLYRMVILSHSTFRVPLEKCHEMCTSIENFSRDISFLKHKGFILSESSRSNINSIPSQLLYQNSIDSQNLNHVDTLEFKCPPDNYVIRATKDGLLVSAPERPEISRLSSKLLRTFKDRRTVSLGFVSLMIHMQKAESHFGAVFADLVDQITEPNLERSVDWVTFFKSIQITPEGVGAVIVAGGRRVQIGINNGGSFPCFVRDPESGNPPMMIERSNNGINSWIFEFLFS